MAAIKNILLGKYFWMLAFLMHFIVLMFLYFKFVINFTNESEKYLGIARRLNFDNYKSELQYLWAYSFYIIYLAVCIKLGFSLYAILITQYFISLYGFCKFYQFIVSQSFFSILYSRICFLVIVTCPVIIYWQLTFYTEIFFLALVMISTYYVFRDKMNYVKVSFLLFILMLCRPVGVFYVISLVFVLMKRAQFKYASLFLFSGLAFVFGIVLFYLPLHFNDFALPVFQGSVICGFPSYPNSILAEGNYTLFQVYSEFLKQQDVSALLHLFFKKIFTFFTITRPYYSFSHNIINSFYYVFILGGLVGVIGLLRQKNAPFFTNYFMSVLISSLMIVILIYNEWSERFMVPLLPFFILSTFIFISKIGLKKAL